MSDTPIHDELQNTIGIDAFGVDRHAEQPVETASLTAPKRAPVRHRRG